MRVAHIVEGELWAGTEVSVANLLHSLRMEDNLHLICIALERGKLREELEKRDIPVYTITRMHRLDYSVIGKIVSLLKAQRIDIVHTHGYLAQIIGGISAWLARLPLITTLHGGPEPFVGLPGLKMRFYLGIQLLALRHLSRIVITVSQDLRLFLLKKGVSDTKVKTVYNAISLEHYFATSRVRKTRADYGLNPNGVLVGTVGRLCPIKGQIYFLKAAREILNRRDDVNFVIVGDGPMRDDLREYVDMNGLAEKVFFTGFVQDVIGLTSMMDVFVLSSIHEGIPMALLEAMALGRPVVVTRVGGLVETVEDGVSGLIVSPLDGNEMAEAILRLLERKDEANRLGRAAHAMTTTRFSPARMADQVLEIYKEAIRAGKEDW